MEKITVDRKKVMVAMSGGVDSSVAAVLLKEHGYEVCGVTIKMLKDETEGTCCSLNDVEDARNASYTNDFRHYVFNFTNDFKEKVIDRFAKEYISGLTPNPCIDCNHHIKFGRLFDRAIQLEMDMIATGHYAKIEYDPGSKRYLLKKAKDTNKDQSYVLYSLTQKQLEKTIFPLGDKTKDEVREYAKNKGLTSAYKKESQDLCFVDGRGYVQFIQDNYEPDICPGHFIDKYGNVLGYHNGSIFYTIGQRKGIGLNTSRKQYVLKKDIIKNSITIGDRADLYINSLIAGDVNMIMYERLERSMEAKVKIRYNQPAFDAILHPVEDHLIFVEFKEPQAAVTPGQAAVFYNDDTVIGGGRIQPY